MSTDTRQHAARARACARRSGARPPAGRCWPAALPSLSVLYQVLGGVVADHDAPVELEALSEDFIVTPTLARLLVQLAARHLRHEAIRAAEGSRHQEHAA